jgi:hypothetical protein
MRSALAPAVAKYQSGSNLEALDIFLELVCGAGYRMELERAIPGALEAAEVDSGTFFDIEMLAIQETWSAFSREQV